jgi:hypothetical protein
MGSKSLDQDECILRRSKQRNEDLAPHLSASRRIRGRDVELEVPTPGKFTDGNAPMKRIHLNAKQSPLQAKRPPLLLQLHSSGE